MWVKICATTNLADALAAVDAGADAVGFVFAASKRQVTAETVASIGEKLPRGVERVGVVGEAEVAELVALVESAGLTALQLHRAFDDAVVSGLHEAVGERCRIIQLVAYETDAQDRGAADERFAKELRSAAGHPGVWAVLVDAARGGASGGLGVAFDWERTGALVRAALNGMPDVRVILAGGLRPDNVAEAIRAFQPWGVDVASGVEASAGVKSGSKVRAFVEAARGARE